MERPGSLWQQYEGKGLAELHRGCGYLLQPHPCELEPPFDPFDRQTVTVWDCFSNDWEGAWNGSFFGLGGSVVHPRGEPIVLPPASWALAEDAFEYYQPVAVEQFSEDESTIERTQQLLLALPNLRRPVAFEVLGLGPQPIFRGISDGREILAARRENQKPIGWTEPFTTVQFVAHRDDARSLQSQLLAHFPNSGVVVRPGLQYAIDMLPGHDVLYGHGSGSSLRLTTGFVWSLKTFTRFDPDPLGVAIAAMEHLAHYEWALLQILFVPARGDWAMNAAEAIAHPYQPGKFLFTDVSDRMLRTKFETPLYAVSIRVMALQKSVFQQLLGWAEQFSAPPQKLEACDDENEGDFGHSAIARCTYRPGLLLNASELASLVHLPGPTVSSERLRRVKTRTRPTVSVPSGEENIVLGRNIHRGEAKVARIAPALRARHCYIAGASGTGKSTLLLNLILQDIHAGRGVGVLDPHGDLVMAVLRRIPKHRIDDVIFFDPADEAYPFALNILETKDENERERIVSETVMSLERYFPASWGPRLERILTYTIHTVLHAIPGATLADVEQMLINDRFRDQVVQRVTNGRFRQYWENEFRYQQKNACDPVLNKLSVFLTHRTVRNIICQRTSSIDFDRVINEGKILLANLSTGMLTEKIAGTFGSFLVTKIVNAAFRRARMPDQQRWPWYLYVDEFQAFMNLSVGFERILAEARKYKLVLAGLANQYVGQLSPAVRQAIFGNVGVLATFRLGVDDANLIAKEMGIFTAEEIMNLDVGEAIVRVGGSQTAHNIKTEREPDLPVDDPSAEIIARMRKKFAKPRAEVEACINAAARQPGPGGGENSSRPPRRRRGGGGGQRPPDEPTDPNEDDLVS